MKLMKSILVGSVILGLAGPGCGPQGHTPDRDVVVESPSADTATDPVCLMEVLRSRARRAEYSGKDFFFCSETCSAMFSSQPTAYYARSSKLERERELRAD